MKQQTKERLVRIALIVIAAVYAMALIRIVMLKYGLLTQPRSVQYVPFAFIGELVHPNTSLIVTLKNVLGNFAIFIPLGVLLPALFNRFGLGRTVLTGFLVSLSFEVIQFALALGLADVDDLILNTLGVLAGAGLYFGLFGPHKSRLRAGFISVLFLAVFGCASVAALWLYSPGMLPAQIEYVGSELLGDTAMDSYDVSAFCTRMEGNTVQLRPGTFANSDPASDAPALEYELGEDAKLVFMRIEAQYSPSGNVQKTTVTYSQTTAGELAAEISRTDGGFADIWLNGNGLVDMLVYTVYTESE